MMQARSSRWRAALLRRSQVHVAEFVAFDDNHFHPGQGRAGGIGAVGGGGYQADVALVIAAVFVVARIGQQTGVLALGTGVGLQEMAS